MNAEEQETKQRLSRLREIIEILKERKIKGHFDVQMNNLEIAILIFELYVFFRRSLMKPELAFFFQNGRLLFDVNNYAEFEDEIVDHYNYMRTCLTEKGYLDSIRIGF